MPAVFGSKRKKRKARKCIMCKRALKNKTSVQAKMGPVCRLKWAKRMQLCFPFMEA